MEKSKTKMLALCAVFTALIAVLSQISIFIGEIPIGFAHIAIFLAAGLLGWKWGTASIAVYVALGAVGVPVFAGFKGGVGALLGPTGGFIFGYIACVFVTAIIIRGRMSAPVLIAAMYAGWVATYVFGISWLLIYLPNLKFWTAITLYVLPFLIGDLAKTILCVFLIKRLKPIFK